MSAILIIDDDVALLSRLGGQLAEAGYQVEKSSDLTHGEQLFAEQRPDLVVLEVRTGDGHGWELLERLAAETLVIVLSGAAREEDVVRAFEAGAVDYVAKPYRTGELLARVRARTAVSVTTALAASTRVTPPLPPAPAAPLMGTTTPLASGRKRNRRGATIDDTVFMSEAEEMAILRTPPATVPEQREAAPELQEPGGLGSRMRAERMGRHMTLVQVENDLKIRMSYLQAMEDEKFTLLPRGPAALQMVRTYADHLGLDAGQVLDEFKAQGYADVVTPLPALGGVAAPKPLPRWVIVLAAVALALAVGLGTIILFDPGFFARIPAFFQGLWEQVPALAPWVQGSG